MKGTRIWVFVLIIMVLVVTVSAKPRRRSQEYNRQVTPEELKNAVTQKLIQIEEMRKLCIKASEGQYFDLGTNGCESCEKCRQREYSGSCTVQCQSFFMKEETKAIAISSKKADDDLKKAVESQWLWLHIIGGSVILLFSMNSVTFYLAIKNRHDMKNLRRAKAARSDEKK